MIPVIGIFSFSLYLLVSFYTASKNQEMLERIIAKDFPILQFSEKGLIHAEKVKEILANMVITGDDELLEQATDRKDMLLVVLGEIIIVDEDFQDAINEVIDMTNKYYYDGSKTISMIVLGYE